MKKTCILTEWIGRGLGEAATDRQAALWTTDEDENGARDGIPRRHQQGKTRRQRKMTAEGEVAVRTADVGETGGRLLTTLSGDRTERTKTKEEEVKIKKAEDLQR